MSTDPLLLDRIRNILKAKNSEWVEKRMFGGVCFMVEDKMCLGTFRNGLMARVGPDEIDSLVSKTCASQMMQKERPMKGYLMISDEGFDLEADLVFWIEKCLAFNPLAKSSKKKQ